MEWNFSLTINEKGNNRFLRVNKNIKKKRLHLIEKLDRKKKKKKSNRVYKNKIFGAWWIWGMYIDIAEDCIVFGNNVDYKVST